MPDLCLVYGIGSGLEYSNSNPMQQIKQNLLMCDYGNIEINTGLGYACAVKYKLQHSAIFRAILGC